VHLSVPQYRSEQDIQCDAGRTAKRFDTMSMDLSDHAKYSALYPNQHLPLQNVNQEGELQVVEDMVDLPFLHEVRGCICVSLCVCVCVCTVDVVGETTHWVSLCVCMPFVSDG
jgi:hypothetical protein